MTAVFGQARQKLSNLMWERRLDISTRGVVPVDHPDAAHYATTSYPSIDRVLRRLDLQQSDVLVDVGSGKGRVLCCAARYLMTGVIGVDLSASLNEQARANVSRARGLRTPVAVFTALAEEFDYSDCTVFYFFSPFGEQTMRKVLSKVHADRGERPVRIAYANPAHAELFAELAWLEQYDFWAQDDRRNEHAVAFYRSRS
jgi:SAM-dependent methyltransferase